MDWGRLDRRPVVVAVAGPNGAGKSTFYWSHLRQAGLRFVNADVLARELGLEPYAAAELAQALRREFVRKQESFVFETVFSDPRGEKVEFLQAAVQAGYQVVLCYIGLPAAEISEERVAMRVSQGGHDVPAEKLRTRFPRTLANLGRAIQRLPLVLVYDNGDLANPYRLVATVEEGHVVLEPGEVPEWFRPLVPPVLQTDGEDVAWAPGGRPGDEAAWPGRQHV